MQPGDIRIIHNYIKYIIVYIIVRFGEASEEARGEGFELVGWKEGYGALDRVEELTVRQCRDSRFRQTQLDIICHGLRRDGNVSSGSDTINPTCVENEPVHYRY